MRMLVVFALGVMLAFTAGPAFAGKLGQCKRCVTDSGIEAHLWSKGASFGFCQSLGLNDGGDGNTTLCDAQAGIHRWQPTNDPFSRCATNKTDGHTAWVGGEKDDLVVISPTTNLNDGNFFRVQDGERYRCGLDMASGTNFTALKFGNYRDLLNIYVRNSSGDFYPRIQDRLQDGRYHALEVVEDAAALLMGNNKDILRLYGVKSNGQIVVRAALINDGRGHILNKLGNDFGLTYGRNKDIRVRYCFTGTKWRYGYNGIGAPYPNSCTADLTWGGYTRDVILRSVEERSKE